MLMDPGSSKKTPGLGALATPTHSRIAHHGNSPISSQTPISPLSLTRRKRALPEEPLSPSRARSTKTPNIQSKKGICSAHTEFPRFVNSFLPPPSTAWTTPSARSTAKSPPSSPPQGTRASSPATPSPDLLPVQLEENVQTSDATNFVLTTLFCYRTRWATHIMCQPYTPLSPPDSVPGTAFYPLGAGLHPWCASLDFKAMKGDESSVSESTSPMLLHLLSMTFPPIIPEELRSRFTHATGALWDCTTKGSSYNVFLAENGHLVDNILREIPTNTPEALEAAVSRIWQTQEAALYGTVAAALRVITGIFLRLNLVSKSRDTY